VALFFDAGNTWIEKQPFKPLELRASYGLEARIFLPIFQRPFRFIYGIKLDPKTILDSRASRSRRPGAQDGLHLHHRKHVLRALAVNSGAPRAGRAPRPPGIISIYLRSRVT